MEKTQPVPRSVFQAFCFRECRSDRLVAQTPEKELGDIFEQMVRDAGFTPAARYIKIYPDEKGKPGGYTAEIILEESSANIYTWPEHGDVEGDIFYCNFTGNNQEKADKLFKALHDYFKPKMTELAPPFKIFRQERLSSG